MKMFFHYNKMFSKKIGKEIKSKQKTRGKVNRSKRIGNVSVDDEVYALFLRLK